MCGIAWQHELGEADVKLYPSKKAIIKGGCGRFSECGIIEVEVKFKRWVKKQDNG